MITLAEMTLRVARLITDVVEGTATAGGTNYLTDTGHLIQPNQYWDRGTLWILTGEHEGTVMEVTGYAVNRLGFSALATPIAEGNRYAVARAIYPYTVLASAIRQAINETFIVKPLEPETPITGDGTTVVFDLPEGASQVVDVRLQDPSDTSGYWYPSTHWHEENGQVIFDPGSPPSNEYTLHIYTKQDHPELIYTDDQIDPQINAEWLRWKAAEYALYWGVGAYGSAAEYRIEERMNRVIGKQKGLRPRPMITTIRTAGQ